MVASAAETMAECRQLLDLAHCVVQSRVHQQEEEKRRYDCHYLAIKLYLHAATLYSLAQGTPAPEPEPGGAIYYDIGSAVVITRAALETYLRMFEVFFEPVGEDEREFRYTYWRLSGLVMRERFTPDDPELREKVKSSRAVVSELRAQLRATEHFSQLKGDQKRNAIKGRLLPRPIRERAAAAGLTPKLTKLMYSYYSSYAHADALPVIQTRDAQKREEEMHLMLPSMRMAMLVLAKMVMLYRQSYESARACCDDRPQALAVAESYDGAAGQME